MHYNGCNYLSMVGLKLNHVSKRGHKSSSYDMFLLGNGYWSSMCNVRFLKINFLHNQFMKLCKFQGPHPRLQRHFARTSYLKYHVYDQVKFFFTFIKVSAPEKVMELWHKGQVLSSALLDWNMLFVAGRWCKRALNLVIIYFASSSNCTK